MKKIISLFKRDYEGDRLVYNEIVPGAEWVVAGEGIATVKFDGTCCMVRNGELYKRYDRKLTKANKRQLKHNESYTPQIEDYKPAPNDWEPAELVPNFHTGHWPGWIPVGGGAEDKWHREAWDNFRTHVEVGYICTGTLELVGPKIQSNPYGLKNHQLWRHGTIKASLRPEFEVIKEWLASHLEIEGLVWHHSDGRMVKIKRKDFGYKWPPERTGPKFRVWNNKSGKMWAVDKLIWDDSGQCHPVGGESFLVYSDGDALMQWTGLLDIDSAEIFEGDIVRFPSSGAVEKVIYDPPCFKTSIRSLRGYECKVIGNIFENSNLLEEK